MDPEKLLAELGWGSTRRNSGPEAPGARTHAAASPSYCSFCWAVISSGAKHCNDCGRSVTEMEAFAAQRAEADRAWVPQRMRQPGQGGVYSRRASAPAPVMDLPPPIVLPGHRRRRARRGIPLGVRWVVLVGAGGLLLGGGAFMFMQSVANAVGASRAVTVHSVPAGAAPTAPVDMAHVRWSCEEADLVYELQTASGKPVASSRGADPDGIGIKPGEYRLFLASYNGQWRMPWKRATLVPGQDLELAPTAAEQAPFHTWLGNQQHEAGDEKAAEKSWRKAIELDPDSVDARLELAAQLAVDFRYREARGLVVDALRISPKNETALRLSETLSRLEEQRP